MEHYGKSSLCPLKYYIGGSVFYESAFEIWNFSVFFFFLPAAITPFRRHSNCLCPVDAEMQSVILACTHLQLQAFDLCSHVYVDAK